MHADESTTPNKERGNNKQSEEILPSLFEVNDGSKLGWHKSMLARDDFDPEDDDEFLKKIPEWNFRELAIFGFAGGSGE